MSSKKRLRIVVKGRFRGGSYRSGARSEARRLGLVGWARNRWDGTVEIVAEGNSEALVRLRDWCRTGPRWAHVAWLSEASEAATGEFSSFEIRR